MNISTASDKSRTIRGILGWPILVALWLLSFSAPAAQVTLAWDPSPGATGYKVYWGTASRIYPNQVDVGDFTSYTVTHLINTITYYFAVTAYNEIGESDYSDEISHTMPPLDPPDSSALYPGVFTWSYPVTSDSLFGFVVSRKETGVTGVRRWRIADPQARSQTMPDLIPGSEYRFEVKAYTEFQGDPIFSATEEAVYTVSPTEYLWDTPIVLSPSFMESGGIRLIFYGPQHADNIVQFSDDLIHWSPLGTPEEYITGRYRIFDPQAIATQRFYRIVQ